MAFKRKERGEIFKFENTGDSLTGYYLGTQDFDGEYGATKKHIFKTESGLKVVIGQNYLTALLTGDDPVAAGTLVRITYEGNKKGKMGKPMKVYGLEVDSDNVLDPAEVNIDSLDSEELDEYPTVETPAVVAKSKGPTSDQIAKMNALIRKNSA